MDDLISRQAAIDSLGDMYKAAEKWGQEAKGDVIKARAESCMASIVEMKLRIENLPPAQPEIVRCKGCKYVGTDATCCLVCEREGMGLRPFHVYHDDYCSYAERRTDG